jgi:hypothetical protein
LARCTFHLRREGAFGQVLGCSGLFIISSHILLSNTDIELTTAIDYREARLKIDLDKIAGK